MSLGDIIARLLGKLKTQKVPPSGWGGWLDTVEGKKWDDVGEKVYDALGAAKVNVHERLIAMGDGAKMTIELAAKYVADTTGEDVAAVCEHILLWLEEAGESDDEERDDGVDIDIEIQRWIDDTRRAAQPAR